jgi:NADPH:quinone reductase-like Zn-dependent oxidoreductase
VVLLGATGGVGSFATQFARAAGAHVIGVTRPEHLEYAREMGSSETIDYTVTDAVAAVSERYPDGVDVLIDLVGIQPLSAGMAELVHEGGRVVSVVMPPDVEALAARGVTGILTSRLATEHQLEQICSGVTDGSVKLPTIQAFPFDEIQAAYAMQATMHVQGKIAIAMAP